MLGADKEATGLSGRRTFQAEPREDGGWGKEEGSEDMVRRVGPDSKGCGDHCENCTDLSEII